MQRSVAAALVAANLITSVSAGAKWCGKNYLSSDGPSPPGGNFPALAYSDSPSLAFRCAPAIRPYLAEDQSQNGAIIVDSIVTNYNLTGAQAIGIKSGASLADAGSLNVTLSVNGTTLGSASVPLNATAYEIPINISSFTPQTTPYDISCAATFAGSSGTQKYSSTAELTIIPNPTSGSVTKMDLRSGALLAKPANGNGGDYAPVFPVGFFTDFWGLLATNLSVIDELAQQGFNMIHPIPTFDDWDLFEQVVQRMQQNNMYLMYDMRFDYRNLTAVEQQVNMIKDAPNLLLWYTGDEPDGTSDPFSSATGAYDKIYELDGARHPVSLVLNCQDYYWQEYSQGADIVIQDVYIIGNNNSYSERWGTPCTPEWGDCGCDNCESILAGDQSGLYPGNTTLTSMYAGGVPANSGVGAFKAISDRQQSFADRMVAMGWERTKAAWATPQAFGADGEYWARVPSGEEFIVQSVLGINHGALGILPWTDPAPADIMNSASMLAKTLPQLTPLLFSGNATRTNYVVNGIDVAVWSDGASTMVMAANTQYASNTVTWADVQVSGSVSAAMQSGDVSSDGTGFTLGSMGSAAFLSSGGTRRCMRGFERRHH
ncbi:hypothetical protein CONPUDRAFT_84544 [Coniophora puteana RWD-64-598 SS2]|uniref:Glycoside hydrolase family 2 protein n=1 Tax=Coniophora puteana (strain RWD-64-598) TaxID=741705 RepID=A0A5M3MD26_CONPW|nr:uncharacterized protein CONPUDRAFT_84544 [Coniophora puteana RWD-64-598 SS2]EIW76541.1 hypothetical protein CONPUDRAFT_84544 [Coniophora puteana RWD-64-598 SS2]